MGPIRPTRTFFLSELAPLQVVTWPLLLRAFVSDAQRVSLCACRKGRIHGIHDSENRGLMCHVLLRNVGQLSVASYIKAKTLLLSFFLFPFPHLNAKPIPLPNVRSSLSGSQDSELPPAPVRPPSISLASFYKKKLSVCSSQATFSSEFPQHDTWSLILTMYCLH